MPNVSGTVKVAFKWWHYAGGIGGILTIIGLVWAVYSHYDMKAHDRELAEVSKSDVEINIDVPDIDQAIEDVKKLRKKAREAIGEKKLTTAEGIKNYWESKKDIFKTPKFYQVDEDYNSDVCWDEELVKWIPAEIYDDMCG
jgi:hypothetical protein